MPQKEYLFSIRHPMGMSRSVVFLYPWIPRREEGQGARTKTRGGDCWDRYGESGYLLLDSSAMFEVNRIFIVGEFLVSRVSRSKKSY